MKPKAKPKKIRSLNIFEVLPAIQSKNRRYYGSLNEAQRKEIVPFILMRWLTGSNNKDKIERLNSIVNILTYGPGVARHYISADHNALLYNLLICCMDGKRERATWLKKNSSVVATPLSLSVVMQFFSYGSREAKDALNILSAEDITNYAEQLAFQKEEISALKKELKSK